MFGTTQADALGAEASRSARIGRRVRVRAHAQLAELVDPLHQRAELGAELRGNERRAAEEDLARRAIERERVALFELVLLAAADERRGLLRGVDAQRGARGDAALAHAARYDGSVARESAARRQRTRRCLHAVDVFG